MQYWLFNTDETEPEGKGKHAVMMRKNVVAAWGCCKRLGAEVTMNRPDPGDVVFYYRAGFGFVGCARLTEQLSFESNDIFDAVEEFSRPVVDLKRLPNEQLVTVAEVKEATGYQVPYRQIMGRILNPNAVEYLLKRFKFPKKSSSKSGEKTQPPKNTKGGFQPDPKIRRKVEKAAIRFVKKRYEGKGWLVKSVEQEKVGYDLRCTKGNQLNCVEVKGTSGDRQEFILTTNELNKAKTDDDFMLYIVINALSNPTAKKYSGEQLLEKFDMSPLSYRVKPKT